MKTHEHTTEELLDIIKERVLASDNPQDELYLIIASAEDYSSSIVEGIELTEECKNCDGKGKVCEGLDYYGEEIGIHNCEECNGEGFTEYQF